MKEPSASSPSQHSALTEPKVSPQRHVPSPRYITEDSEGDEGEYISRSAAKKEVQAITSLGVTLSELSVAELDQIPLSSTLKKAVTDAKAITSFNAKKRQIQYLGKLLRNEDYDAIGDALKRLQDKHKQSVHVAHQCELWRDRLLTEGKTALSEFIALFPEQDIQQLRQLIRQAQKEQRENKPPASARKLFRWVREQMESAS